MSKQQKNKQELEEEIKLKNQALLAADKGIFDLMVYNHENFAYRYLETSQDTNLSCQFSCPDNLSRNLKGSRYWVESIEPDIFTALKWKHPQLKPILIDLCKTYPGKLSQKIQLKLELSTDFKTDNEITCSARVSWDFPDFLGSSNGEKKEITLSEVYSFTDLLELRNHHAVILERVASLF